MPLEVQEGRNCKAQNWTREENHDLTWLIVGVMMDPSMEVSACLGLQNYRMAISLGA